MSKKIEIETFHCFGDWELSQFEVSDPSCFNSVVAVRKYRVTIEEIPEEDSVIAERLEKLWGESANHHDMHPLSAEAKRIGYEFKGEWGSIIRRKS